MFKNYFKTAIRNLSRNRIYALLNVLGLALGVGCAFVIFKVISYERSFDTHHKNYESIYRIVGEDIRPNSIDYSMGTPHPLGPAIEEDFSEVKSVLRTHQFGWAQINVRRGTELQKFVVENEVCFVDNSYFKLFELRYPKDLRAYPVQFGFIEQAYQKCIQF